MQRVDTQKNSFRMKNLFAGGERVTLQLLCTLVEKQRIKVDSLYVSLGDSGWLGVAAGEI